MNYFEITTVMNAVPAANTFMMVGKGGVGKSYSTERFCLEDAILRGRGMVYVGRYKEDSLPSAVSHTFEHLTEHNPHTGNTPVHEIIKKSKYPTFARYRIETRGGEMWVCGWNDGDPKMTKICRLGVTASIQTAERFKRGSYPGIYNIFFDEFITKRHYIFGRQEPVEFKKIINTVARTGKDYRIFMAGNPDNEIDMNPYLENYNLSYDTLDANCVYTFDDGKTVFVKIANDDSNTTDFIAKETQSLFGVIDKSRHTGEVDRPKVKRQPDDFDDCFTPIAEFRVETSVIAIEMPETYRRSFYMYLGQYHDELYLSCYNHRHYRQDMPLRYVCRYDKNDLKPSGDIYEIYRFRFPPEHRRVDKLVTSLMAASRIFFETDKIANVLTNTIIMQ